ncbi:hypothetical protein PP182_17695 [Maribacter sp. PR1]|uniref:GIY-YIG domain-containing protein n=1 Tax=Maribacter cobaltidurans TaxID=1178778 RepID=A0ABU7IY44_9FLAO|nr:MULTISPECIES: hypothetical protein [Maribacter]MDC6390527.1 hypothetical protein [Maribacter sp. PR1]MEE1977917.1 hypothetical protein [Maribacter cobaltidurans]
MTLNDIIEEFKNEFGIISNKFVVIEEDLINLSTSGKKYVYHPGVYVFFLEGVVVKVGRHLTNSRKRALEHIKDNTKNNEFEMASLKNNVKAKVLLFNLENPEDYHWSASVEMFLEKRLSPIIESKRKG